MLQVVFVFFALITATVSGRASFTADLTFGNKIKSLGARLEEQFIKVTPVVYIKCLCRQCNVGKGFVFAGEESMTDLPTIKVVLF